MIEENRDIPYRKTACIVITADLIFTVVRYIGICVGIGLQPFEYTKLGVIAMWFIVIIGFKLMCVEVWAVARFYKAAKSVEQPMQTLRPANIWMMVHICNTIFGLFAIFAHFQPVLAQVEFVTRLVFLLLVYKFTREVNKYEHI